MRDYGGYEQGQRLKEALVNLVFPRRCPVCDEIVPAGEGMICASCRTIPQYIQEPRCRKCGKQLLEDTALFCSGCIQKKHIFDYGYAVYDYQSMRKSIYRFKYANRCEYASFYAKPIHASKLKSRGYNQAQLIARELSQLTGIPIYENIIKRVRKTVPQKELGTQERQNNLKKAFNISADVVKLNKTIVIDDIYTTGSTLDAVALELKRHGVRTIYFITLCIGDGI